MKKQPTFSLKDQLFNPKKVGYISESIKNVYTDFQHKEFEQEVLDRFSELELTARITHMAHVLQKYLPDDFTSAVDILIASLPKLEENETLDNNFGDFIFAPYSEYIAIYGIEKKYLQLSYDTLAIFTAHFSAEYAIRCFYNIFPEETFIQIVEWSKSGNYHLRRLASEGSRPNLPWGKAINLTYTDSINILDVLYTDKSRYVTRSVANHLNDISKKDPDLVIDTLEEWKRSGKQEEKEMEYIINHSTRTLVKKGDKRTLEFLGYRSNPNIEIKNFIVKTPEVRIGEKLVFGFELVCKEKEKLMIDYKIYFPNKKGELKPKVFKIRKGVFSGTIAIEKKHMLKMMTTKALYEGEYMLELVVNGKSFEKKSFILKI